MIVEEMLRAGARVIFTSRRDSTQALAALAKIGECHVVEVDLGAPDGVDRLTDQVLTLTGKLGILINNAGTTWGGPLETFPDRGWASVMDLNVRVPFAMVQRLLPSLEAAGTAGDPARVINIGSIAGTFSARLNAYSYSASKAALHHLGRELAAELGPRNIAVNTIVPGYFSTKMTAHIRADEHRASQLKQRIPLGRFGEPRDIGALCVFLSSPLAAYISGAQILLDGGLAAAC